MKKAIIYSISIVMISGVFSSIGKVLGYFLPISDYIRDFLDQQLELVI